MVQISPTNYVNPKQRRFIFLFITSLVVAFSPSKALGQIWPFIFYTGLIFYVRVRPVRHIQHLGILIGIYIFCGVFYWLALPQFQLSNYLWFFVTFSAMWLLVFDFRPILTARLLQRLGGVTLIVLFFESIYGVIQGVLAAMRQGGFGGSVGDYVWGTIAPPLQQQYAGTSPIFVMLISTLLLFTFAVSPQRIGGVRLVAMLAAAFCWLVASLLHSVVFFTAAAVTAVAFLALLHPKRRLLRGHKSRSMHKGLLTLLVIVGMLFLIGGVLYPENYARITQVLVTLTEIGPESRFLKLRAIYYTTFEVPQTVAIQPFIGVGPGQYASRAALMLTGEYLTRANLPFLPQYTSHLTEIYIMPFLGQYTSSNHFPSSSWMALYGEMGIFGLLIITVLMLRGVRRFCLLRSTHFPRMNLGALTLLLYIVFMGLQTVYWEYTQAIFPAILTLKLMYDYLGVENVQLKSQFADAQRVSATQGIHHADGLVPNYTTYT